jgi:Zn-dependent protease
MPFDLDIRTLIISLFSLLVSVDVHEFAHAWAALRLGDDTAQRMGRLTLNPLAHLDPMGTVMILLTSLTGFGIGWGKPVPFNPGNLRVDPRTGSGLVSVAGPVANIVLAILGALPLRLLPAQSIPGILWDVLASFILINVSLAVFNLLPVSPLDGHSVLLGALATVGTGWARRAADLWERLRAIGPSLLLIFIIADNFLPVLDTVLEPPVFTLVQWMLGPTVLREMVARMYAG